METTTEPKTITNLVHKLYKAIKPDAKTNAMRGAIDSVHLNSTHAYVTNGHFLIVARKDGTNLENVNVKPLKDGKAEIENVVSENCLQIIGSAGSVYEKNDGQYPSIDGAYPVKHTGRTIKLGINADYLKRIADVMGKAELVLEIEITESEHVASAIKVTGHDKTIDAVIMPVRV